MRIKDLTPYTYTRKPILSNALAIGWLEGDDLINNVGKVHSELISILKKYEIMNTKKGFHICEYCSEWAPTTSAGNGEIWVFGNDGKFYIAPYLIIHYIEKHDYKPPKEFSDAVVNGFRPHSPGYLMKMEKLTK